MNKLLVLSVIFLISMNSHAKWVEGYIVTSEDEHVKGSIQISVFDSHSYGYYMIGFDMTYLYNHIKFRHLDKTKEVLEPCDIRGFSFSFKGVDYHFISQIVDYKSIVRNEREYDRFLNVVYSGTISLCRNRLRLNHPADFIYDETYYYDYYLVSDHHGFTKVERSSELATLKELLLYCKMDNAFLQTIEADLSVRDLQKTLYAYDRWLEKGSVAP